ncbi:UxaA family hydrolase [Sphingomonas sp. JC676]|uniref:UxaA family hydrolase n=1 Tax=Sphingomonas sp. JC676 TaxID=2768065 RepID=UPI0016577978|nr:UxaA family hydrolase [Sphingomonas sp. JC676]MBC9035056.1 UxaA family hydrolase [Sphingomonas sp. JC676]
MTTAFRIHAADNVATLLGDAEDSVELRGEGGGTLALREPIALGHKVALVDIGSGAPVVKFGITIGTASGPIRAGDWVHLHNIESSFDERSGSFDVVTGVAKDTSYD